MQWRIHGARVIEPPKIFEINFIHHDFVQLGKQHIKANADKFFVLFKKSHCSRYMAILPSIFLSQQCCDAYFLSLTVKKQL